MIPTLPVKALSQEAPGLDTFRDPRYYFARCAKLVETSVEEKTLGFHLEKENAFQQPYKYNAEKYDLKPG